MLLPGRRRFSRRHLQVALGLVWLVDAGLQFQPFMFTRGFADQVLAPSATGQPRVVRWLVVSSAHLVAQHPVVNLVFALVQLGIGLGLLWRRTARYSLWASIPWAIGVWVVGEGLGGIASGAGNLALGTPGAALCYVFVALACWPVLDGGRDRSSEVVPSLPAARWSWAFLFAGGVGLAIASGTASSSGFASGLRSSIPTDPSWMVGAVHAVASAIESSSLIGPLLLVIELGLAIAAFCPRRVLTGAAVVGGLMALGFWSFGEGFGQLWSGQATDPNSGPLIALMAVALATAGRSTFDVARINISESSSVDDEALAPRTAA